MSLHVTQQTRACAHGTLMHDPTIRVEGNTVLFTGFQPCGGWEHSSEPCFSMRPSTFLAPHQAVSQKHAPKFPISLFVLKLAVQTVPHPLWKALRDFRVAILLQQLSPSGSGVHCPQSPCGGPGKHVPCYTGSWWSPGRHGSQESGLSICPSEKQKSAFPGHRSAFQASPTKPCLVRQAPAHLHQLSPYIPALMAEFSDKQK